MGVRAYLALVLAVMASAGFWIAEQYEWVGRGKARALKAAKGGTLYSQQLRPSFVLDLGAGHVGKDGDLRLVEVRGERPQFVPQRGAKIALAGAQPWEDIDARTLAGLPYAATGLPASQTRDAVYAVRMADGRLAKLRVLWSGRGWALETQWVTYPPAEGKR